MGDGPFIGSSHQPRRVNRSSLRLSLGRHRLPEAPSLDTTGFSKIPRAPRRVRVYTEKSPEVRTLESKRQANRPDLPITRTIAFLPPAITAVDRVAAEAPGRRADRGMISPLETEESGSLLIQSVLAAIGVITIGLTPERLTPERLPSRPSRP
jgi:hypothetical protein